MRTARLLLAVGLLLAAILAWAALPMAGAHAGAKPALIAAISCSVLGLIRLGAAGLSGQRVRPGDAIAAGVDRGSSLLASIAAPGKSLLESGPERLWRQVVNVLMTVPWPQG